MRDPYDLGGSGGAGLVGLGSIWDGLLRKENAMRRSWYEVLAICLVLLLAGCWAGLITESREAKHKMLESKNAYQTCLRQNLENIQKCKGYKEIYEIDLRTYNVINDDLSEALDRVGNRPTVTIKDNR